VENGESKVLVLYWYQSHGRVIASEYWAKIYMVVDALRLNRTDSALVRIATTVHNDERSPRELALDFAEKVVPQLDELLPR
jgi:EpsI family protein